MRPEATPLPITLESLIVRALNHSAQVKVFSDLPLIRETSIIEAQARFDWTAFMDTRWTELSEPVGNVLTVGPGATRFRDDQWNYNIGARRTNVLGGRFEAAQRYGYQRNNSTFFQPNDQGTSRLTLGYTQPLLRGAGKEYNTSLIVLAKLDTSVAREEMFRQLQAHLLEVTRAYWGLYLERGSLLQRQRLYQRAEKVAARLEARGDLDANQGQVQRVRAAVKQRASDLLRAEAAVKNAEDRIRALVNDPELSLPNLEIVPADLPAAYEFPAFVDEALETAMESRPEIRQTLKQLKASCVRMNIAKNELLPQLDAVLETYVSGLRGNSDIGGAWEDQFSRGEPSYSVGLVYEVPIYNRAAKARYQRRRLELRQLQSQFRVTVETLGLEVKVAVREVQTAYQETLVKQDAMAAANSQLAYLTERYRHLPGENGSAGLYLEDLLRSQAALATTEYEFLQAQTTYSLALMNLKRATGSLLQDEMVTTGRACVNCLPTNVHDKPEIVRGPAPTPYK